MRELIIKDKKAQPQTRGIANNVSVVCEKL
jgi:hypothetical protein